MEKSFQTKQDAPFVDAYDRRLFVGGLGQEMKDADIYDHFHKFGDIHTIDIKTEKKTGQSRGYAFVLFKTAEGLKNVIATKEHLIKGNKVYVEKARSKNGKVFVSMVKDKISDDDLKSHFEQFGKVIEFHRPINKSTNEKKSYCYITFKRNKVANDLIKAGFTTIKGDVLEVQKYQPKSYLSTVDQKDDISGRNGKNN